MIEKLILAWLARGHRSGRGLQCYRTDGAYDYATCHTHNACRGRIYRRDRWALKRRSRGPSDFTLN